MGVQYSEFVVSEACYPRYAFTKNQITQIMKRKRKLLEKVGVDFHDEQYSRLIKENNSMDKIILGIQQSNEDQVLSEKDLFLRNADTIDKTTNNEVFQGKFKRFRKAALVTIYQHFAGETYCNKIAVARHKTELNDILRHYKKRRKKNHRSLNVCLKQDLSKEICRVLEINVFKAMKDTYKVLQWLLAKLNKRTDTCFEAEDCQQPPPDHSLPIKCMHAVSRSRIAEHEDKIEYLLDDITGMYNRSHVPEEQRPTLANREKKITVSLLEDLQKLSGLINSCGYRRNTLCVFVDVETPEEQLVHGICKVLNKHKIYKHSVISSAIKKYTAYASGSKFEVYPSENSKPVYGTLGGYVRSVDGKNLCALIPRHLAKVSYNRTIHFLRQKCFLQGKIMAEAYEEVDFERDPQNSANRNTGRVLDLAVAYIDQNESGKCDFNYATEKGEPVPGILCELKPHQMNGLNVHIWGATSTFGGFGRVTISKLKSVRQLSSDDESLIIVEDRTIDSDEDGACGKRKPFCEEGDSGSMVCTDDPETNGEKVQLISTVMGKNIGEEGLYTTAKLKDALEQIEKETKMRLLLC